MRLVTESGLWSTSSGPQLFEASPLVAVLEVSGAVLHFRIDEPSESVQFAFTDLSRADWLWRVLGEAGHAALVTAASEANDDSIDVAGVDIVPGSLGPLRRLAIGHWLRRWWPASLRDGIAGLDRALLDAEVALLTADAQGFFTDDTLDSDVGELLAPHADALLMHLHTGDPRIGELVRAAAELADELGVDNGAWPELGLFFEDSNAARHLAASTGHRDDYALAAGSDAGRRGAASISRGVASVHWAAVPPGIFDAAEDTVDWSVETAGPAVVAVVHAEVIGPEPATGIPVRVRSGTVSADGSLSPDGRARLPMVDAEQQPMTESAAWNHDWPSTSVVIGADVEESRETRDRVRNWVRARLDHPPQDAFLAEILAAESAY
ncbi:hypothetical protein BST27_26620 [Mycobacterium intermedium]|uniref:Uncharacterized protein n=1 Tax=Mycobacterium intermedium TaxID=28445 RepID=A0A1E3SL63_MYCIE|nr:hypothetical protein [Mycobacterium intermedium]MCV6962606.1 hypothetical protein [Mycobacterium intermedium]ODR02373.1 hypothetical protein BHQ20_04610 [Mycobacterium intermedium]OPE48258.1 hypothetical protein BV508_18745 [Mycobacterium intermedium]ORA95662.1 hypothetical protein BST27_26620 [Mycobacterium intermedium]